MVDSLPKGSFCVSYRIASANVASTWSPAQGTQGSYAIDAHEIAGRSRSEELTAAGAWGSPFHT